MADEPNSSMDRMLRDYASERGKGGDIPLHPATRKMLAGEVSRAYGVRRETTFWARLQGYWPQIAFGSGLATILLVAVLSLRQPPKTSVPEQAERLETVPAQNLVLPQDLAKDTVASAPSPPPALAEGTAPEQPVDSFSTASARQRAAPRASADRSPTTPPSVASKAEEKVETAKAIAPDRVMRASELTNLGAALRVRFVELPDRTIREPRPSLLTSFQVEQIGDDLRFYDQDGSVYSGQLFVTSEADQQKMQSLAPAVQQSSGVLRLSNTAEHYFTVQGTNRTLAKPVVVQGRYLERTNPLPAPQNTFSFTTNSAQPATATQLSRFRRAIVGRATVGQTNQVPVNAVSLDP